MSRFAKIFLATAAVAWIAAGRTTARAATWSLGVEGPGLLHAPEGGAARGTWFVTLRGALPASGTGAEGWSWGLRAEGGRIVGITLSGTEGNWAHAGGSSRSELVGGDGAFSVTSLPSAVRLEAGAAHRIAAIEVEADAPPAGASERDGVRLRFVDDLPGPEGPIVASVREDGESTAPHRADPAFGVDVLETSACPPVDVGFSVSRLDTSVPWEGILGSEAVSGEVGVAVPPGATGEQTLFVNLITTFDAGSRSSISGFSFSIDIEGDAVCLEGRALTEGLWAAFERVDCVDPAKNSGRRGMTAAIIGDLGLPVGLPHQGTRSVLEMRVAADGPQTAGEKTARLGFQDGLVGPGQPVPNAVTVDGATAMPCTTWEASATLRFRGDAPFSRGDANGDGLTDISDAVRILGALFLGTGASECPEADDVNDDGAADISDAVALLGHLFLGAPAPPAPFGECGLDSTPSLGCAGHPACE